MNGRRSVHFLQGEEIVSKDEKREYLMSLKGEVVYL